LFQKINKREEKRREEGTNEIAIMNDLRARRHKPSAR
jgi:hypothetical protein